MSDEKKPRRFKAREDYTAEESLKAVQAQRRGEPEPKFEREDYRKARREALADAGLEDDERDNTDKPLDEMSVGDHVERIQSDRHL